MTQILTKEKPKRAFKRTNKVDKMSPHNFPCRELGRKLVVPNQLKIRPRNGRNSEYIPHDLGEN